MNMSDFFPSFADEFDMDAVVDAMPDDEFAAYCDNLELVPLELDDLEPSEEELLALDFDLDIDMSHEPMRRSRPRSSDWR